MTGRSGRYPVTNREDEASWDERHWDAVQRQEQKKQDVLVMGSQNSETIRRMVRQVDETRNIASETLVTLDTQSGVLLFLPPTKSCSLCPHLCADCAGVRQSNSSACMEKSTR
jgi:hypothetical protein